MNVTATELNRRAVPRVDFGRVTVFFGDKNGKYPDANQVIVRGSDTQAAFDTPIVANHIGAEFDRSELVILGHVHEDHMAGLHRLPNAPVHVHEADLAAAQSWEGLRAAYGSDESYVAQMLARFQRDFFYVPRPDAIGYADGAVWQLGQSSVRAFHMPGHTAGHCVLLVEPEGVAFIGDIDLSSFGPYYGDASSDLRQFQRSLAAVRELDARVWVTSHHRGVITERAAFEQALARFAAKIDERHERLLGYLREGPHTLAQLVARRLLYPVGFDLPYIDSAERRSIQMHLELLIEQRLVQAVGDEVYALAV